MFDCVDDSAPAKLHHSTLPLPKICLDKPIENYRPMCIQIQREKNTITVGSWPTLIFFFQSIIEVVQFREDVAAVRLS